jgi:hypothetical protein
MAKQPATDESKEPPPPPTLKFKVAPHLVQDLGLNLYTNLAKVLVEFVANAYDADSITVNIEMDFDDIECQRAILKAQFEKERKAAKDKPVALAAIIPLGKRTLPPATTIRIVDRGCGMSWDELDTQFLVAGRRRREEAATKGNRSPGDRLLMGRKGVGKLAGFGVAHKIVLTTRKKDEPHATRIVLDYDEIGKHKTTNEIEIPHQKLLDGGGIPKTGGTEIVLSHLLHEPLRSRKETIEHSLADHFWLVKASDFTIKLNGKAIKGVTPKYRFAWPNPGLPASQLVEKSLTTEDGQEVKFSYRMRFRDESLNAADRGVRVYAHNRLAAAPSLLDAPTGMHGFRQTDYLDGVVEANFVDDQSTDYIATDRQSLRWETPLLIPMRKFLSEEIEAATKEFQKVRDEQSKKEAEEDTFTNDIIAGAALPKHRAKAVYRMAAALASICKGGIEGDEYKDRLPILVGGVAQGDILTELQKLAKSETPNFNAVVDEVTELTRQEFGDFGRYIRGRLDGIQSLVKIIKHQDFAKGKNEKELHELLQRNAWLIDPTFTQFLTSNQTQDTVFSKLAAELKIGTHAPPGSAATTERPDLVFLLHNQGLNRVVIVELKAPNVKLEMEHLLQLRDYVRDTKHWLKAAGRDNVAIESILIGSRVKKGQKSKGVLRLEDELDKRESTDAERVYDLMDLLDMTQKAHEELLGIYNQAAQA